MSEQASNRVVEGAAAGERENGKDRTKGMMKQGPNIMSILFDGRFLIAAHTHRIQHMCVCGVVCAARYEYNFISFQYDFKKYCTRDAFGVVGAGKQPGRPSFRSVYRISI